MANHPVLGEPTPAPGTIKLERRASVRHACDLEADLIASQPCIEDARATGGKRRTELMRSHNPAKDNTDVGFAENIGSQAHPTFNKPSALRFLVSYGFSWTVPFGFGEQHASSRSSASRPLAQA